MRIILLRHGESEWNRLNKFTGWEDVDLTKKGEEEAQFAGSQIHNLNIKIDTINTSLLLRAMNTAKIVSKILNFPENLINYHWELNERHYGALQGLNKREIALKYGEKKVLQWRRSFDISPPLNKAKTKPIIQPNYRLKSIDKEILGESLKDVIDRLYPFWVQYFKNLKTLGGNHLIVAHSNSLRAIIKIIEGLTNEEILEVNVPTGVPKLYDFNEKNELLNSKYLIDDKSLKEKQNEIIAQSHTKIKY